MTFPSETWTRPTPENVGIEAVFCDIRPMKTSGMTKLIFEIPSEMRNAALERLFGLPDPANPLTRVMIVPFKVEE